MSGIRHLFPKLPDVATLPPKGGSERDQQRRVFMSDESREATGAVMRIWLVTLGALCFSISAVAQARAPWQWSARERAAAISDPAQRSKRLREHEERNAKRERRSPHASVEGGDVFHGSTHPELFFPTELYRSLVTAAFIRLPTIYYLVVEQHTSDLFLDPADWEYLRSVSTEYVSLIAREEALRSQRALGVKAERSQLEREIAAIQRDECVAMAAALRTLRARFGRERFDRTLYEVQTPSLSVSFSHSDAVEPHVRRALAVEENCQ